MLNILYTLHLVQEDLIPAFEDEKEKMESAYQQANTLTA